MLFYNLGFKGKGIYMFPDIHKISVYFKGTMSNNIRRSCTVNLPSV